MHANTVTQFIDCNMICVSRRLPRQAGQAYAEFVVGIMIAGLFLYGSYHVWRYAELAQMMQSAARFAAWERTVWEPEDGVVEKHAVHKSSDSLAKSVMLTQFAMPQAWHKSREGTQANGSVATADLKPAMKTFVADTVGVLSVKTDSRHNPLDELGQGWKGRDPTYQTVTSLDLDSKSYRRTDVTIEKPLKKIMSSDVVDEDAYNHNFLGFKKILFDLPSAIPMKSVTLLTNAWEASPPVNRVRGVRQLLPFSSGDPVSGTKANWLAYFGGNAGGAEFDVGDLVGMVPAWNLVAGPYGFGGQYVVKQIGLDGAQINTLGGTGDYSWNPDQNLSGNLGLQAQWDQREYFQPAATAAQTQQRHLGVQDKTASDADVPWRNSVLGRNKRKYMAYQLKNPVNTYFAEGVR